MRGALEKVRAVHDIGQTTQNPASPSEKWGLGIQFMASPYFGVYKSQRNFKANYHKAGFCQGF